MARPIHGFALHIASANLLIAFYTFVFKPSKHLIISSYTVGVRNHRIICHNPTVPLQANHAFWLSMLSGYLCHWDYLCCWATYVSGLHMLSSYPYHCIWATYAFWLPIILLISDHSVIFISTTTTTKNKTKNLKIYSLLILDSPEGLPSLLSLLMGYLHSRAYWWATFAVKPTNWLPSPSSLQMGCLHRQAYWRAKFTGKPTDGLPCKCKCKKD